MSAPVHASLLRPAQFNVAKHYDAIRQLDQDVYRNRELAESEVETAIRLIGSVPERVFLPCFGTGRHIRALLARGVKRIVGVDLSRKCVEDALRMLGDVDAGRSVDLHVGDLTFFHSREEFDASILLGNSFGDITDPNLALRVTRGMVRLLSPSGVLVMDYIGPYYLDRCHGGQTVRWEAEMDGVAVYDDRTPRYDPVSQVMSIDVRATRRDNGKRVWKGTYQKLILDDATLRKHFATVGITLESAGPASNLNPYYANHSGELGMIGRSHWWTGRRSL